MTATAEPVLLEAREIKESARVLARAFHEPLFPVGAPIQVDGTAGHWLRARG